MRLDKMKKRFSKQAKYIEKQLDEKGKKYFIQIVYFIEALLDILELHGVNENNFSQELDKVI